MDPAAMSPIARSAAMMSPTIRPESQPPVAPPYLRSRTQIKAGAPEEAPAAPKKTTVWEDLERTMQEQYCAQLKGELVAKKQVYGDLVLLLLACEHCRMAKKECFFVNRSSGQLEKCVKCVLQKKKCEGAISKSFLLQSRKSQLDRTSRSIRDGCPRTLNGDEGTIDYS